MAEISRIPQQVQDLTRDLQALDSSIPLLIAVDQEGGHVSRLAPEKGFTSICAQADLGMLDDVLSTQASSELNAQMLLESGFNVNLAPCVDLELNPDNFLARSKPFIFARCFQYGRACSGND